MQNRIKDFRNQFKMTQEELADQLSVSRQTIVSLEKGKYKPSIVLAFKIAKIFKTSIEGIFIMEEEDYQ